MIQLRLLQLLRLLFLEFLENPNKEISFYIAGPGGLVTVDLGIYDNGYGYSPVSKFLVLVVYHQWDLFLAGLAMKR